MIYLEWTKWWRKRKNKNNTVVSQFWNRQIMKVFLTMLLLPCCTVGLLREGIAELDDMEQHFEAFVAQHGRVYATVQERAHRFAIFKVVPPYFFQLYFSASTTRFHNILRPICWLLRAPTSRTREMSHRDHFIGNRSTWQSLKNLTCFQNQMVCHSRILFQTSILQFAGLLHPHPSRNQTWTCFAITC